ncbi:MAG: copper amine oxidase N-terminal domain-containing protein [Bacillota bacterium]|nr:copper amine oxidase N-terminal domain-containing protein [Bacillota bacterium]
MKRRISLILVLMLVLSTGVVFADDEVESDVELVVEETDEEEAVEEETDEEEAVEEDGVNNGKGKGLAKKEANAKKKELKLELEFAKDEAEQNKDLIEDELESLKDQYEELIEAGNFEGAGLLVDQISELELKFRDAKIQMKQMINERKMIAREKYTEDELAIFTQSIKNIREMHEDANVLDVGSVMVKDNIIKFDTPPYIKGGRTVVPVRALTEGLGASVSYDNETRKVTIVKDGKEIVLLIGSNEALVNGEIVSLDSKAEITNSRTYVPIRFISEIFGLNVQWDGENEVIDVEEETPADEETPVDETPIEE